MLRFVGRLALVAVASALTGCELTGPGSLGTAREVWENEGWASYEYVGQKLCFCLGPVVPVIVTVVNDKVAQVREQESGAPHPVAGWLTVHQMFEEIETAHAADRLLRVRFDEDLGYPELIDICCQENDSGITRTVTDLYPIAIIEN